MEILPPHGSQTQFEANVDRAREQAERRNAQIATQAMLDQDADGIDDTPSGAGPLSALLGRIRSALHAIRGD